MMSLNPSTRTVFAGPPIMIKLRAKQRSFKYLVNVLAVEGQILTVHPWPLPKRTMPLMDVPRRPPALSQSSGHGHGPVAGLGILCSSWTAQIRQVGHRVPDHRVLSIVPT